MAKYKIKDLAERLQKEETTELKNKMLFMWTKQEVISLKEYNELVKLILYGVRLSLFNEVYDKFVECENDDEFTQYLNENTNEA
jgi:hypothetical protein